MMNSLKISQTSCLQKILTKSLKPFLRSWVKLILADLFKFSLLTKYWPRDIKIVHSNSSQTHFCKTDYRKSQNQRTHCKNLKRQGLNHYICQVMKSPKIKTIKLFLKLTLKRSNKAMLTESFNPNLAQPLEDLIQIKTTMKMTRRRLQCQRIS